MVNKDSDTNQKHFVNPTMKEIKARSTSTLEIPTLQVTKKPTYQPYLDKHKKNDK
jgi:hypothetical protein